MHRYRAQTESVKSKKQHEKILEVARKRFEIAEEAEAEIREKALEDSNFRGGDQWPAAVLQERKIDERPCLTVNKMPQVVRNITNEQRKNRPAIKVYAVDDKADKDTAKILSGHIKHIEYSSDAEIAYDTAFEQAVTGGYGYFRVFTQYCDPMSFKQELRIGMIKDRFKVYLDPFFQMPDGSDANWGFIVDDMPHDDFMAEFGKSDLAKDIKAGADWRGLADAEPGWVSQNSVRIAEYFFKEYIDKELLLLDTGAVVLEDDFDEWFEETYPEDELTDERREELIKDRRTTQIVQINWLKLNFCEVLEESIFPGEWVPIIPVLGDDILVDGKRQLEGIIRHAKDPQRMLNYWASAEAEAIALAPKTPFIAAEGQIPPEYENQWAQANKKSYAYLPYKPKTIDDQLVPPPSRSSVEPPVQAISVARQQSGQDIKDVTGIYDDAAGMQTNAESGVAITRRQNQSQQNGFHYHDNLARSIRHCGRILVRAIPVVYDVEQTIMIMGEDDKTELVKINAFFEDKETGEKKRYRVGFGKYDVTVDTGPSFQNRRQEALESMLSFVEKYPAAAPLVGDLIALNSDWAGSQEIAERLKTLLPPELKGEQPLPPEAAQKLQELEIMVKELQKDIDFKNALIAEKTFERQQQELEIASKERIEFNKQQNDLRKAMLNAQTKGAIDPQILVDVIGEIEEIRMAMSQMQWPGPPVNPPAPSLAPPQDQTPPPGQGTPPGSAPGPADNINSAPAAMPGLSPERAPQ